MKIRLLKMMFAFRNSLHISYIGADLIFALCFNYTTWKYFSLLGMELIFAWKIWDKLFVKIILCSDFYEENKFSRHNINIWKYIDKYQYIKALYQLIYNTHIYNLYILIYAEGFVHCLCGSLGVQDPLLSTDFSKKLLLITF